MGYSTGSLDSRSGHRGSCNFHAKRVLSLANGVVGVIHAASGWLTN